MVYSAHIVSAGTTYHTYHTPCGTHHRDNTIHKSQWFLHALTLNILTISARQTQRTNTASSVIVTSGVVEAVVVSTGGEDACGTDTETVLD